MFTNDSAEYLAPSLVNTYATSKLGVTVITLSDFTLSVVIITRTNHNMIYRNTENRYKNDDKLFIHNNR